MRSSGSRLLCGFVLAALLMTPAAGQQDDEQKKLREDIGRLGWQTGPAPGKVARRASIVIPKDHGFLAADDTSRFMALMKNLPRSDSYTIAPLNLNWFAVFDFQDVGYVKDDEKIDADAVLKSLKENNVRGNEERKQRGLPALYLEGWFVAPRYDEETKRLEWATRLRGETGRISVNYNVRLLGRSGVMNALLVTSPDYLDEDVREFKTALTGFSFDPGERYAEFRSGDKVAEYGLTALIVGGAAVAAGKAGLFKALGKFAVFIFAGLAIFVGGIFKWLSGRRTST